MSFTVSIFGLLFSIAFFHNSLPFSKVALSPFFVLEKVIFVLLKFTFPAHLKSPTIAIAWRYSPQVHSHSHSKYVSSCTETPVIAAASIATFPEDFKILFGTFAHKFDILFMPHIFCTHLKAHIKAIDFKISFPFQVFARNPSFP
jgi:hypothetical protein